MKRIPKTYKPIILSTLLISILLIFNSTAFAAWEVYTYDSGNFLARIFNALAIMTSSGENGGMMRSLVKIATVTGLLVALLSFLSTKIQSHSSDSGVDGFVHMLRQVLLAAVANYLLMIPKADVLIVDRANPSQSQPVSDVPFFTAVVAHASSTLGSL